MSTEFIRQVVFGLGCGLMLSLAPAWADEPLPKATIDGTGPGWRELGEADFVNVNTAPDTWAWKDGTVHCKGTPVGVTRSQKQITNFEMVAMWRHLKSGGNSGIFVWATEEALTGLKPNSLPPGGIEVQVLDHGYAEQYEKQTGKKPDWFTTHGDVFPVGKSKMTPFPPTAPKGSRSFPSKNLSKGPVLFNCLILVNFELSHILRSIHALRKNHGAFRFLICNETLHSFLDVTIQNQILDSLVDLLTRVLCREFKCLKFV